MFSIFFKTQVTSFGGLPVLKLNRRYKAILTAKGTIGLHDNKLDSLVYETPETLTHDYNVLYKQNSLMAHYPLVTHLVMVTDIMKQVYKSECYDLDSNTSIWIKARNSFLRMCAKVLGMRLPNLTRTMITEEIDNPKELRRFSHSSNRNPYYINVNLNSMTYGEVIYDGTHVHFNYEDDGAYQKSTLLLDIDDSSFFRLDMKVLSIFMLNLLEVHDYQTLSISRPKQMLQLVKTS